jgi:hypothetical protein
MRAASILIVAVVTFVLLSRPSTSAEYDLPLHSFGVTSSSVLLRVDDDNLVPFLVGRPIEADSLEAILPYQGSVEATHLKEENCKTVPVGAWAALRCICT